MMMTKIRSLPRYNLPFLFPTHLHKPSPIHYFNFVANGHPYKITVNDKVCFSIIIIIIKIKIFILSLHSISANVYR